MVTVTVGLATIDVSACKDCPHAIITPAYDMDPHTGERYPDSWWCAQLKYWRVSIAEPDKVDPRCPFLKKEKEGAP